MAIITRYFGTTDEGAANATTWDDRVKLIDAGTWASEITGFDFAGANSLLCLIGPGTHTVTSTLPTVAPTDANPLIFHGCDSSGIPLVPPEPDWVSAMSDWDDSSLPILLSSSNIFTTNVVMLHRLMKITGSGVTANGVLQLAHLDWCSIISSNSTSTAYALNSSGPLVSNCIIGQTGTAFKSVVLMVSAQEFYNCRLRAPNGSSGDRNGLDLGNNAGSRVCQCTVDGVSGKGLMSSGGAGAWGIITKSSFVGCGGDGIELNPTASQTFQHQLTDILCTGNGEWGIDIQSSHCFLSNIRTRDNVSSGITGNANYPIHGHEEDSVLVDATEFVDHANGDYRIRSSAFTFGKKYGAGDGPRIVVPSRSFSRGFA